MDSKDYHDYVIKDGKFVGKFEEMYQNVEDPWLHGDALEVQYDIMLDLIKRSKISKKGLRVLDIGCGKGAFTSRFKKSFPNSQITAYDISETAIKKAKEKYKNLKINFQVLDIQKGYNKIKDKFELIIISQLMWYILPSLKNVLDYLEKKVLLKGGYILINQTFYKEGVQKYGKEFIKKPEDLISLLKSELLARIDTHKIKDFDSVMLFKKNDKQ
jgi:SAM-dependent methyltransferase